MQSVSYIGCMLYILSKCSVTVRNTEGIHCYVKK